jgi:shikimate dehydrogenase
VNLPGKLFLLGHPVEHSLSPVMQNAALKAAGIDLKYKAKDVPPEKLEKALDKIRAERGAGNITAPHKNDAFHIMTRLSDTAKRVGAVNTFLTSMDGKLHGHNTDVDGFDGLVRYTLGGIPPNAVVALIGAGGSAAAVLAAVEQWKNPQITIYARRPDAAAELAARFKGVTRVEPMPVSGRIECTMVVNATTIGLRDDLLPIPVRALPYGAAVLDLVYRAGETAWVRAARRLGMPASDGLPMLVEQGAASFEIWIGKSPDRNVMWQAVRSATGRS